MVFAAESALKEATLIHGLIVKLGFGSNVFVMNALLRAYVRVGRFGSPVRCLKIFLREMLFLGIL